MSSTLNLVSSPHKQRASVSCPSDVARTSNAQALRLRELYFFIPAGVRFVFIVPF